MALQADKQRLLLIFTGIGCVLLLSQLAGYRAATEHRLEQKPEPLRLSANQVLRLKSGKQGGKRGGSGYDSEIKLFFSASEEQRTEQLTIRLDSSKSPKAARRLAEMCVFKKLTGLELLRSTAPPTILGIKLGQPVVSAFPETTAKHVSSQPLRPGSVCVPFGKRNSDAVIAVVQDPRSFPEKNCLKIGEIRPEKADVLEKIAKHGPWQIEDCREVS
mmetsp:Transcript_19817/g.47288  ORF Transcript_19817/g.47288 Transcript_19817/m.47288 type:complete len:217 (-) Transcript_19817:1142-1792(-)